MDEHHNAIAPPKSIHASLPEAFQTLEIDLDLFNWREADVAPWPLVRYPLYEEILAAAHGTVTPWASAAQGRRAKRPAISRLKDKLQTRYRELFPGKRDPFHSGPCDILVLSHPRRKFEEGRWWDLYVDPLLPALSSRFSVRVAEPSGSAGHLVPEKTHDLRYWDLIQKSAAARARRSTPVSLSSRGQSICRQISCVLGDFRHSSLVLGPNFEHRIKDAIIQFRASREVHKEALVRLRAKLLVVVNYWPHQAALAAARDLGINSVELQHGSPGEGKLNYHHPGAHAHPYFADYFFSFGRFWTQNASLPIPDSKVFPIGFTYLSRRVNAYDIKQDGNRVLVVSQPTCREELAQVALELLAGDHSGNIEVLWKNHPSEEYLQDDIVRRLHDAGAMVLPPGYDLYAAFADAPTVIGGYSTALFESVAFGRRPQLIRTRNSDSMVPLVELGGADFIDKAEDVSSGAVSASRLREELFACLSDDEIAGMFARATEYPSR